MYPRARGVGGLGAVPRTVGGLRERALSTPGHGVLSSPAFARVASVRGLGAVPRTVGLASGRGPSVPQGTGC